MSHQCHCPVHGDHNCSCCPKCHESCSESEGDCSSWFLELADQAWSEVLKEKMKEHILATKGDHLKELAKIIAEANQKRWQTKMASKRGEQEFKEKMCTFFSQKQKG